MEPRFPKVNPNPTAAQGTTWLKAWYKFLAPNAKDAKEHGVETFEPRTGITACEFALTIGDGGPRDVGPASLAWLAANGNNIGGAAATHHGWHQVVMDFIFPNTSGGTTPTPVEPGSDDLAQLRSTIKGLRDENETLKAQNAGLTASLKQSQSEYAKLSGEFQAYKVAHPEVVPTGGGGPSGPK